MADGEEDPYSVGADDGYRDGHADGLREGREPLIEALEAVVSEMPPHRQHLGMEAKDWERIAEEMSEIARKAVP